MPLAKPLRLIVVGFGRVGQVCAEFALASHDLLIAAIVRRPATAGGRLPETLGKIPVVTHIRQAGDVDGALICVPTNHAGKTASQILQHGIPVVDCVTLHENALQAHKT